MTEMQKLKRANSYIAKLANGFNPLTDVELPLDTILNNINISRCLFYVSDILTKVIENGGVIDNIKKTKKVPFSITYDELIKVKTSKEPLSITEFCEKISAATKNKNMDMLSYIPIMNWLLEQEYLKIVIEENGKKRKNPTDKGIEFGISQELRSSLYGRNYIVNVYDEKAQKFILDNFFEITDSQKPTSKDISTEESEVINENLIANH